MKIFKWLRAKWRIYRFFKHVNGLTPTGYCFMDYCKNIKDGVEQARIAAYEESFTQYVKALSGVTTERTEVASIVFGFLSTIYKNYGINN